MKSYFKFLSRNKLYTIIEAVGLIVSLAFVLLTGHYVWKQRQMTRNVPDYKDVYTVYRTLRGQSGIGQSWGFAYQARESVPEIEKAAMFWKPIPAYEETIELNSEKYHVESFMVGGDFFDIFPADFESGGPEVMADISNVIISRSFANRLGGETNAIGSVIDGRYTVAAIIKETPNPIFGDVDVIYNIENLTNRKNAPFRVDVIPFVKVRKGTDREALEVKADTLVAQAFDAFGGRNFLEGSGLVRYDELWFSPANNLSLKKGSRTYTGIIFLVTIILLLSAIFNYINLNVALSGKRTKEMATRKILGAGNESLFAGRMMESFVFTSVCFLLAAVLAEALTPWFNRIAGGDGVPVKVLFSPGWIGIYLLFICLVSLIQGYLPAWIGTRIPAISVVKGEFRSKRKHVFSKVFIVLQQGFSIVLLALAIVLGLQMSHMLNRPLGADVEGDFYVHLQDRNLQNRFAEKALSLPSVGRIGHSSFFPGLAEEMITEDKDKGLIRLALLNCDRTAFEIFGFNVEEKYEEPENGTVWIARREMTRFGIDRNTENLQNHYVFGNSIGGIVEDFAPNDILNYDPSIGSYIVIGPSEQQYGLLIETVGDRRQAQKELRSLYSGLSLEMNGIEDKPYMFGFITDILSERLAKVKEQLSLVRIFMLLSLLLSILGLIAMSSYYADESSKDIAIRKVFGSTMEKEIWKTVLEYLILLGVAAAVAIPIAIRLASRLLEQYSYRISGYGWVFVLTIVIATLVAFLSILWQTLKAARTNPADTLKKE
ncbi:MAG: ABC transporter permease [Bacteroidales bacterium]|nr:ABC transporter permease [Bacteroidales bacterium]